MALAKARAYGGDGAALIEGTSSCTGVPFGTAATGRVIWVMGVVFSNAGVTPTSMTIAGIPAWFALAAQAGTPGAYNFHASAIVPTGTSGTVANVGGDATNDYMSIASAYQITGGASQTPTSAACQSETDTKSNVGLAVAAGSETVGGGYWGGTWGWTGLTTDASGAESKYSLYINDASKANATATTLTVGPTGMTTGGSWAAATFAISASVTGTGAATFGLSASGAGAVGAGGTGAATLGFTASGSGSFITPVTGTGAATLGITASASGARGVAGSAASTLGLTASAAGTFIAPVTGAGASTLTIGASASGVVGGETGTGAATLAITASGTGKHGVAGSAAATFGIGASGIGTFIAKITGTGAPILFIQASGTGSAAAIVGGSGNATFEMGTNAFGVFGDVSIWRSSDTRVPRWRFTDSAAASWRSVSTRPADWRDV